MVSFFEEFLIVGKDKQEISKITLQALALYDIQSNA
jgi:hypothetical protein